MPALVLHCILLRGRGLESHIVFVAASAAAWRARHGADFFPSAIAAPRHKDNENARALTNRPVSALFGRSENVSSFRDARPLGDFLHAAGGRRAEGILGEARRL